MDAWQVDGIDGGDLKTSSREGPTPKISGVALPRKLTAATDKSVSTTKQQKDDKRTFDVLI
jgi:hypothetical protein